MKTRITTIAALALLALHVSLAQAAPIVTSGAIYNQPFNNTIGTVATAVTDITGATPNVTFTSTLINGGFNYNGGDSQTNATFLGATDAATATGATSAELGTAVVDLTGTFVAPWSGFYSFKLNNDDGGAFFLNGTPGTPGSGTEVAKLDGDQAPTVATGSLFLTAGAHNLEYVYYNSTCCNYDGSTGGGGAAAFASITAPEPSSMVLVGLGAAGLFLAARRRRNG